MAWELSVIKARHQCMIDIHLAGASNVKIAEEMDCTPESVGMVLRSPIVQEAIARRRGSITKHTDEAYAESLAKVREIMHKASPSAAQKLVDQIDHQDPRVAQAAAKSILEQTFVEQKSGNKTVVQISVEQANILQQTLAEIGA